MSALLQGAGSAGYNPLNAPLAIANMTGWWKADAFVASDGDAESTWTDQSGLGHHFLQASGTLQPLYKTGQFGSLPGLKFDGSNDEMLAAWTMDAVSTVVVVGKFATAFAAGTQNIIGANSGATGPDVFRSNGTQAAFYAGSTTVQVADTTQTAVHAYGMMLGTTTGVGACDLYVDGATGTATRANVAAPNGLRIGKGGTGAGTGAGDFIYGEVLCYGHKLTLAEWNTLRAYFQARGFGNP